MKKLLVITLLVFVFMQPSFAAKSATKKAKSVKYYGTGLCANPNYDCITIKKGGRWKNLFPDPAQRDLLQRINRTNMYLYRGRKIAVPHNLKTATIFDVSPFPLHIKNDGEKTIIVDQEKLAWGAYGVGGNLVKWGPISSGKNYCRDVGRRCTTISGIFYIFQKKDKRCVSNIFPVGEGGAKMPYCMFLYRGFALHGSDEVPGYRDSHGCVRLFTQDAKWLNEDFVELPSEKNDFKGTKVIVQDLLSTPQIPRRAIRRKVQTQRVRRVTHTPHDHGYSRQRRARRPYRGFGFFR